MKVKAVDFDHPAKHLPAVMSFEFCEHFLQGNAMEWVFGAGGVHEFCVREAITQRCSGGK
jgi:hypothetical protein